ncbi:MAG: hypothetical protein IT425_08730 [Pirellulales bacterium]|nr:hypothetical protein [Pirellulales bacterium]
MLLRHYRSMFNILFLQFIALAAVPSQVSGELLINEIYFDPPGSSGDNSQEYIELRGTPNMSLDNHYLVLLECENDAADTLKPGQIEFMFDLNGRSLSTNGFLSLRQKNSPYSNVPNGVFNPIMSGTGNYWGTTASDNDIGARSSALYSSEPGKIENSGFTAMLVRINAGASAPVLGQELDGFVDNNGDMNASDHDGLDYPNGVPDLPGGGHAWDILDSIGVFSELSDTSGPGEAIYGRTYAKINFGPEIPGQQYSFLDGGVPTTVTFEPNITIDQVYVGLGFEVEMVARWGNSTGQTAADWHITNLTNNPLSGFTSIADGYRQSGAYHDSPVGSDDFVQTNQFVPYGANLTSTIGSANYPANLTQLPWDYNANGTVDAADYIVWRKTFGSTTDLGADGNNGKLVEEDDYAFWRGRFGDSAGSFDGAAVLESTRTAVPEPVAGLFGMALTSLLLSRRR